jgi:transposase InsO family protein
MFYALCHVVDSFVDVGKNTPKKSPPGDVRRDRVAAQNQPAGNLQKRCCTNVWTGDITYLWTEEGWVYLAVVIDLFSRQIVGFAMSERMTRRLVIDALRMAWFRRRPTSGLIFHSDRGS